jgi:PII-like signaling protein
MRTTSPSRFEGRPAKRLTVLMGIRDQVRHTSLELELLKRARRAKLAGATVFQGDEGFGASGRMHRDRLLKSDRPLAVVFVDQPERIDAFLDEIAPLLADAVAVLDDVEILDL